MKAEGEQVKLAASGIVECPVQETPLGKGILLGTVDRIKFSVQTLELIIDYSNVTSFGSNGQRVIVFIRNEEAGEDEDREQDFNIDEVNEIRESLQKKIAHTVNLVGPYKFFLDFDEKEQAKRCYDALVSFSKHHQNEPAYQHSPKQYEMEGMGNILESMKDDNNFDILHELDD